MRSTKSFALVAVGALALLLATDNLSDAASRGGGGGRGGGRGGGSRGGGYRGGAYRGGAYRGGAYRGYGNRGYGRGYGYGGYGRGFGRGFGYGGWGYGYPYGGWGGPFWYGFGTPYLYGGYAGPDYVYDSTAAPVDSYAYDVPDGQADTADPAQSQKMGQGRLVVDVPAAAEVWVEDKKSHKTGPERVFRTPKMPDGWRVTYRVRARWQTPDGQTINQKKIVSVPTGKRVVVDFNKAGDKAEKLPAPSKEKKSTE